MKKVLGRLIIVLPAVGLQVVWILAMFKWYQKYSPVLDAIITVIATLVVLYLICQRKEASYKIMWILLIILLPIVGIVLFFTFGNKNSGKNLEKKTQKIKQGIAPEFPGSKTAYELLEKEDKLLYQNIKWLEKSTGFSMVEVESAKYLPFGEDMLEDMCVELQKAEEYIFLEYFIINNGVFWGRIKEILAQKAKEGVDVRVMYDDLGSIALFSYKDVKELQKLGIKCIPFNPFILIMKQLNNRDHRKILVIDGKVAYTGGINLSDEYINETHPFGRWKDTAVKVTGEPVKQFTYMFLEFWDAFANEAKKNPSTIEESKKIVEKAGRKQGTESFNDRAERSDDRAENLDEGAGYVLPYYDSPNRNEESSNTFYTALLSSATEYIWFYTPYLMLGENLRDAFVSAAERGVDVRIILPGIPDKILVNKIAKSYYRELTDAGIKLYEYKPGFVHAKGLVVDDKLACVGSVNLDYRSLFLHFEVNTVFYKSHIIEDVKADFLSCQAECEQVEKNKIHKNPLVLLFYSFIRLLAPLL